MNAAILTALMVTTLVAQQPKAYLGDNDVQIGITHQGSPKLHMHNSIGVTYNGFNIGYSGVNELDRYEGSYRNGITFGHKALPWLEGVYLQRHSGKTAAVQSDKHAYGARFNFSKRIEGYVDVLRDARGGIEVFSLSHLPIKKWELEPKFGFSRHDKRLEYELKTPPVYRTDKTALRFSVRHEVDEKKLAFGMTWQF
jgi:hypothetical protein